MIPVLRPDLAPMGGMPKPNLLVACNNICGTVLKWYESLARHFDVPLLVLDTPFLTDELTSQAKEYVLDQLVSAGTPKSDILAGVCDSVANRVASMTRRTGLEPDIVFTGGVAHNQGVVNSLAKQLGYPLLVFIEHVITAAFGVAILAREISK